MTQCVRLELRAAGFQNGVFVALGNRVGAEGEVVFCREFTVVDVVVKARHFGTGAFRRPRSH